MEDDSSSSIDLSVRIADSMEFTLGDTLEVLKDLKLDRDGNLERMYEVQVNNQLFAPLDPSTNFLEKQQELTLSFTKQIAKENPDEYPIPNTIDMYTNLIRELTKEIENVEKQIGNATQKLRLKEEDVAGLKEKYESFEGMRAACLSANKNIASKTYEQEIRITSKIFQEVKEELHSVVAKLFPNNENVRDLLATLSIAYFTSGDDVYVDIAPEDIDVANFLLEAGLLAYHRYDENKVRLVHL